MPSIHDARGKLRREDSARVVDYLKAGKIVVLSPGFARDALDAQAHAGTRSIKTDGIYAWPDVLAYYVERYDVELPAEFEAHMQSKNWQLRDDIDVSGLELSR